MAEKWNVSKGIKRIRKPDIEKIRNSQRDNTHSYISYRTKDQLEQFHNVKIKFSFIYFDKEHEAFNCGKTNPGWFLEVFENIKQICGLTRNEFQYEYRTHYDSHKHDFSKTAYKYRLPIDVMEQNEEDCCQFRISTAHGRVHGFFIDSTFYIVWLDPHHNMNPDERYGGIKFYDKPLTPYNELLVEAESLKKENKELIEMLDELTSSGA